MKHKLEKHEKCEVAGCPICEGGLSLCEVCGGAEGSLTSECSGRRLFPNELDAVHSGQLNYGNGRWWVDIDSAIELYNISIQAIDLCIQVSELVTPRGPSETQSIMRLVSILSDTRKSLKRPGVKP